MPNYPLFTPKIPLFNDYFALFSHVVHGSKGGCLYHFSVSLCLIGSHLAAFYLAFCTISPCILHQNALHLAAYCTAFSTKTHFILLKMAQKWVLVAVSLNKNSFRLHVQLPPLGIKTNLRENRFFAARWAVGGQKRHS